MAERRPMGALEAEVLDVLWRADGPVTPADVRTAMGTDLAYTTVMTILVRAHAKGYVSRTQTGRTYMYEAAMDEAALAATLGQRDLRRLIDRYGAASLARFADDLGTAQAPLAQRLRELADDGPR